MRKLFGILLITLSMMLTVPLTAKSVHGRVLGPDSQPLIGAGVFEKGSASNGTVTDMDGNYQINTVGDNPVLVFSYIGCVSQEIKVGESPVINVTLQDAANELNSVVVTALGIKREAKALGYAVTNVSGEVMPAFSKTNPLQALSGLVPGLNVSSSGSGAGGSNKVTIRGVSSLTGSNEPLYVVDGVPVDNAGGASGGEYGGTDYGSSVNNINPDDIENISVLKGGAAAALYGSRGQNGVIMITTKKGSRKSELLGVKYSYQLQLNVPSVLPDFQKDYSQGSAGVFNATNYQSWGVKMNGQEVTNFLGQKQTLQSLTNPYKDFFQTGISHNHSVAVDKRGDNMGIYVSYTNTEEKGIVPENRFDKNSFTARLDATLGGFVSIDVKANYIVQKGYDRPDLGGSPDNPVYAMYNLPRSVSLDQLEQYQTRQGEPIVWTERYTTSDSGDILTTKTPIYASSPLLNNPYWSRYLNTNKDVRNRLISFAEANLDFKKLFDLPFSLNLKGRAGIDYYTDGRYRMTATNTYFKANGLATMSQSTSSFKEMNYDFLLSASKRFGKFGVNGSFGGNLMKRYTEGLYSSSESGTINTQGPYVIQNFNNVLVSQGIAQNEIQSLYGLVSLDWDNQFYLDLTARNDWTSMLSAANRSIFYPSVSASWILSQTFRMPKTVDLLKLRASWASVGSGGNYSSYRYSIYGTNPNQFHGLPYGFIPSTRVNPDLKSEFTISREVGTNFVMFGNRLNIDLAYYNSGTKDQIFKAAIAPSSGNNTGIINAGYISNSGIEAQMKYSFIRTEQIELWAGVNFTYQWNKVKDLPDAVPILTLGGISGMTINAQNGIPVGSMQGTAFNRDENGNIVLDKDNLPTVKLNENGSNDVNVVLGNIYPEYLVGFNTGFSYKRLSVNLLIDGKLNYDIYSYTNMAGSRLGVLASTVRGRDEWEAAKTVYAQTGILPNMGYTIKGVKDGVVGEYAADPQQYWSRVASINENWVYDASFIRLRQVTASYAIPKSIHHIGHLGDIGVSLSAINLFYLMKNTPNISPESVSTTGNAAGYEVFSMPETMTFTFGVNVSF